MKLTTQQTELLESFAEYYPDFPGPGVLFKDLSWIYTSKEAKQLVKELIIQLFEERANEGKPAPDCVIGCDARGFIIGTMISMILDLPFVLARKPGKLPGNNLLKQEYVLEYGKSELQIQKHIIEQYKSPIISDDLLATGGTCEATTLMLNSINIKVNCYFFLSEIIELVGRKKLEKYGDVFSLLK